MNVKVTSFLVINLMMISSCQGFLAALLADNDTPSQSQQGNIFQGYKPTRLNQRNFYDPFIYTSPVSQQANNPFASLFNDPMMSMMMNMMFQQNQMSRRTRRNPYAIAQQPQNVFGW